MVNAGSSIPSQLVFFAPAEDDALSSLLQNVPAASRTGVIVIRTLHRKLCPMALLGTLVVKSAVSVHSVCVERGAGHAGHCRLGVC